MFPGAPALAAVLAAWLVVGTSLARDEKRAERVLGDDDPITLPTSVAPEVADPILRYTTDLDPETTGSVSAPNRQRGCTRLVWFPDRTRDQFRSACQVFSPTEVDGSILKRCGSSGRGSSR